MKSKILKFVGNSRNIIIIYVLFALLASIQGASSGPKTFGDNGAEYTEYNNYVIFKKSFEHLKDNQDLYALYPEEHWDLYKYTPTFAAFFGVFSISPDVVGLSLWNLLNALLLLLAVYYLPKLSTTQKGFILLFVLLELLTNMQNEQSNGLIAGLLIMSFGLLERKKLMWASLCVVFSVFIKIFGVVGFALFLFYPQKWKLAMYTVGWTLLLLLIPLIWIDLGQYTALFESYKQMLSEDHSISYGYSVMGWIYTWFSIEVNKNIIVLIGAILFMVPLVKFKLYQQHAFKYLTMVSILIWVVIFNHKAESPTYIIAMAGAALWFIQGKKNTLNTVLFVSAFVFTSLSPTDLFPRFIRESYVNPYLLKAVPCILIWFKIIYDMILFDKSEPDENVEALVD